MTEPVQEQDWPESVRSDIPVEPDSNGLTSTPLSTILATEEVPELYRPDWPEVDWESNLVQHAWWEFKIIGEELEWVRPLLHMITIFAGMGHSGFSASVFNAQLTALLDYKALAPISNYPGEWVDRTDMNGGEPMWQNIRNSSAFSHDGGKTYYLLAEREMGALDERTTMHDSADYHEVYKRFNLA